MTKDIRPYELVLGNPARHAGWMSEFGHKLKFNDEGVGECPESKGKYKLENGRVTKQ